MGKAADYLTSADFQDLCKAWQVEGKCPMGFPDWLRELGLDSQADAAQWALDEPSRDGTTVGFRNMPKGYKDETQGGIRPFEICSGSYTWYMMYYKPDIKAMRSGIPRDNINGDMPQQFNSFAEAIVALLDNWKGINELSP